MDSKISYSPEIINSHQTIVDNNWLKLKKNNNFIYSERKGIDSIAFILLDINVSTEKRVGLINEYKNPIDKFLTTAFGGSIDDEKYYDDLRILVIDEVMEEAGFEIGFENINYYGKVFCSTQMNQFVHLFTVQVDRSKQIERTTKNPIELKQSIVWMSLKEVSELNDWKSNTILFKRMLKNDTAVIIKKGE